MVRRDGDGRRELRDVSGERSWGECARGREAVAASQANRDWSTVIGRAFSGEVRFVVEKHGTPVTGIVSADDIERLAAMDARWAEGHEVLKRFGRAFRDQAAKEIEEAVAQRSPKCEPRIDAGRRHGRSAEDR